MPTSYLMTAPMSDNELVNLLMQSPLYQKLQDIRDRMSGVEPKSSKDQKEQGIFLLIFFCRYSWFYKIHPYYFQLQTFFFLLWRSL